MRAAGNGHGRTIRLETMRHVLKLLDRSFSSGHRVRYENLLMAIIRNPPHLTHEEYAYYSFGWLADKALQFKRRRKEIKPIGQGRSRAWQRTEDVTLSEMAQAVSSRARRARGTVKNIAVECQDARDVELFDQLAEDIRQFIKFVADEDGIDVE